MSERGLAEFLRDRRARLRPSDVGLSGGGASRRRTPGLRRDEVAMLSRMSTDYYTEIEQARGARPSREMLDAMAKALRLSLAEREHLHQLAGVSPASERSIPSEPPDSLLGLLDRLTDTAVLVFDAKLELLAWNALAGLLVEDFSTTPLVHRNLARRFFLHPDPAAQHFGMSGSGGFARYAAAELRVAEARYPHDVALAVLIAELRSKSPRFERLWRSGEVVRPKHMAKRMVHPTAGPLLVQCDTLIVPECDQRAVLFTAKPRTRSARLIRAMAASIPVPLRGTRKISP